MQVLVGCDPEIFVKNPTSGQFVSAHGMIQGTKLNPFKVTKGAVQVDGNALEFNIDPARNRDEFLGNVKQVYAQLKAMVPGFNLVIEPTAVFDPKYFSELPEAARELGCDPDFCAWTRSANPRPMIDKPFRTAGGHIHIGWRGPGFSEPLADKNDPVHFEDCIEIAKQCDYYLGINAMAFDKDTKRRLLYGRAGCFRAKPYGVEYRSLSNAWLMTDDHILWAYDQVRRLMDAAEKGKLAAKEYGDRARTAMDTSDYTWGNRIPVHGKKPPGARVEAVGT